MHKSTNRYHCEYCVKKCMTRLELRDHYVENHPLDHENNAIKY